MRDQKKASIWKSWYNWSDEFLTPADVDENGACKEPEVTFEVFEIWDSLPEGSLNLPNTTLFLKSHLAGKDKNLHDSL